MTEPMTDEQRAFNIFKNLWLHAEEENERLKNNYHRAESWRVELAKENERLRQDQGELKLADDQSWRNLEKRYKEARELLIGVIDEKNTAKLEALLGQIEDFLEKPRQRR